MRLASYRQGTRDSIGAVNADGTQLFDLPSAWSDHITSAPAPRTMLELIEAGPATMVSLRQALPAIMAAQRGVPIAEVALQPPVRRPSKIVCLALNNSANSERIMQGPKHPATFIKPASSLIGHDDSIELRADYGRVHPEPELAVIIGKEAKNVRAEQAYDHVFGYTAHNDITGATMRGEDTFHYRAIHPAAAGSLETRYVDTWVSYPGRYKGSDSFGCMGPWLVTADDIADPHDLAIACGHQGRVITEDNTANLTFKTPEVIAFLSRYMTLWPGDIVSMGTALKKSGSGGAVQNVDLYNLGGPVTVTIERIGTLSNGVRRLDTEQS
ncbi:fumarylacetoacetate hydrolase family protein [Piscinibacter sp.]|uniref:fumarylacetoacetate hydrolase family protein n=1 Tax=Piscinibacter sp. TaxID=1903157 RepID=UPI0039E6B951